MRASKLIARIAAIVAAALALLATVSAALALPGIAAESLVVELWRVVGLATWAALFLVLGAWPGLVALWLVALASKLALVIVGLVLGSETPGASDLVLWDGLLVAVLAIGAAAALRARSLERVRA